MSRPASVRSHLPGPRPHAAEATPTLRDLIHEFGNHLAALQLYIEMLGADATCVQAQPDAIRTIATTQRELVTSFHRLQDAVTANRGPQSPVSRRDVKALKPPRLVNHKR